MYRLLLILLLSFTFTQEPCEGTCFSEEEVVNITNNIKELQFDVEKYKEIEGNLNLQIKDYIKNDSLNPSVELKNFKNNDWISNKNSIKIKILDKEITIIDIGFNNYLNTIAQPVGFYSQSYMEARNRVFVNTWNTRARNPLKYHPNIYENIIDYQPSIDYGYDVNYKLFNYFLFAQRKYKMSLGVGFRNRLN